MSSRAERIPKDRYIELINECRCSGLQMLNGVA